MEKPLPDYFVCPMSQEIMLDPVILPSGYTYDRRTIQRWIDSGKHFCPITNLPLPDPVVLVPNRILRTLISKFTPTQPSSTPSSSTSQLAPTVPALNSEADSPNQLGPLVSQLNSAKTSSARLDSLSQLARELKSNPSLRCEIPKSGAITAILQCVNSDNSVFNSRLNSAAFSLLIKLSSDNDNDNIKSAIVAEGALPKLIAVLRGGDSAAVNAAWTITYLCISPTISYTVAVYPGAIRSLISLLKHDNRRIRRSSATALFAICYLPENRRRTIDCEVIPVLVNSIRSGLNRTDVDEKEKQVDREVSLLGLLAQCEEGMEEILSRDKDVVDILVRYLKRSGTHGDSDGVYYGLFVLNLMCCLSKRVKDLMKIKGGFGICLGLIGAYDKKVSKVCLNLAKVLI